MITDWITDSQPKLNTLEKHFVTTPATAESLAFSPLDYTSIEKGKEGCEDQPTLFHILSSRFEESHEHFEPLQLRKEISKTDVEERNQEYEFNIVIGIKSENGEKCKIFPKKIIKSFESETQTTLVFDRQHEKVGIDEKLKYVFEVSIETPDGFIRKIWENEWKTNGNGKKWAVLSIQDERKEENSTSLNIEMEKIGKLFIKPLSINLPKVSIEEFFDLKFKLLNKSDLLSTLQTISELKGILDVLSRQNMGSRIIQKLLSKSSPEEIEDVIRELNVYFKELICDRYGNYVFQKVFKLCNFEQKNFCLEKLKSSMFELLQNKEGTHTFQLMLDYLTSEQIVNYFLTFSAEQILELCQNKFSMHFMQKMIEKVPSEHLFSILMKNFSNLASDKFGVVVLKKVISMYSNQEKSRFEILKACQDNIHLISFSEYGHYVMELVIDIYNNYELQNIFGYVVSYVEYFIYGQYSSSVVKKCIEKCGDYISVPIIHAIEGEKLKEIMESGSGEFVLHRLLELTSNERVKNSLVSHMMVASPNINCYEKRQKWLHFFNIL